MTLEGSKLTYFNLAGRGEGIRLAFAIGGVQYTDERVEFSEWPELKPSTPFGSLPVLTLSSGKKIAQQRAIIRLVGQETGLVPKDTVKAALVDSLMEACEDMTVKIIHEGQGLPKEEKEAARAKTVAEGGVVYKLMQSIDDFIGENGTNGYCVGDSITIADLTLFTTVAFNASGFFDGVPLNAFDSFPNIMAVRKAVRSNEAVAKWYDGLDPSIKLAPSFGPF